MEVYLIRHTKPKIPKGVCYGQADVALEEGWEKEVFLIKEQVFDVDQTFSSPLTRCRLLAEKLDDDICYDDRLKELNFGEWEQKAWDDIDPSELQFWMKDYLNVAPPGGENAYELLHRVKKFLKEVAENNPQKIAIVGHLGVFRSIYSCIENVLLQDSFSEFNLAYGEVAKLSW